ncbi:hypothetical protein HW48_004584 [Salmonella enterica subsp. enterica]|nr:hypothetical protein [Salmonella enterica subsp. enterica]EJT0200005.1 hypothetical protein [Salmonella enterica]EKE0409083.1 hypothetical protein [Salmonella enterica]
MRYLLCEVEQFLDEELDGTLCRVKKVLQMFDDEIQAEEAERLFDPSSFGDYDTVLRVVRQIDLHKEFR